MLAALCCSSDVKQLLTHCNHLPENWIYNASHCCDDARQLEKTSESVSLKEIKYFDN